MQAIDSINKAIYPKNCRIEIIIIVNACNDNTLELLDNYKNTDSLIPLTYIIEPRPGKSLALNCGINSISDAFICFIDDDQKVNELYFNECVNAINKFNNIPILCGRLLPDWTGDEPDWIHNNEYKIYPFPIPVFDLGENPKKIKLGMELPPGGQVIIHSSIFEKFGNFSESLGPTGHNLMGSEDTDFFERVLRNGGTIQYVPEIIQYHFVDNDRFRLLYLLKKCFQRNRSITISRPHLYSTAPFYLATILARNMFRATFSTNSLKTRFYLMRSCSTLGEISGAFYLYLKSKK
ncbi:MAG: glycosyltransferase [Methylomonas sp.]|nr:glycosyltransferase [Methylomonas sp.]